MEKHDIIIVGGGPSGTYTSEQCRKKGLKTLLIDQKDNPGSPIQCSGLISKNIDRFFKPPKDCIEHTVKGAVIHSPGGKRIEMMKKKTAAYVIDRQAFDRSLIDKTKTNKLFGTRVDRISIGKDVTVSVGKETIKSEAIVGADGPNSVVRRYFRQKPQETVAGIIAIEDKPSDNDYVELWFNRNITDGFLWRIPRKDTTEYGMLGKRVTFPLLKKFFKLKEFEKRAGSIPIGLHKTYFNRALLVGDAASQTKPWSGGGVVYGMTCGKIAADVLKDGFKNNLSEDYLSRYQERWHKAVGKSIKMGLIFREFYRTITNKEIDQLFESFGDRNLSHMDMDFPLMDVLK